MVVNLLVGGFNLVVFLCVIFVNVVIGDVRMWIGRNNIDVCCNGSCDISDCILFIMVGIDVIVFLIIGVMVVDVVVVILVIWVFICVVNLVKFIGGRLNGVNVVVMDFVLV